MSLQASASLLCADAERALEHYKESQRYALEASFGYSHRQSTTQTKEVGQMLQDTTLVAGSGML